METSGNQQDSLWQLTKEYNKELSFVILVTFDLDGVLIKNPFNRHVFPTLAHQLGPYLHDNQHLPLPTSSDGQPLSLLPDEIRIPGLNAREREIVAAIFARAAVCLDQGMWRDAYDWDAAVTSVARELGCQAEFDVAHLVQEGCRLGLIGAHNGAEAALRSLAEAGAKLVALSNGFTRYQKPVLEALQFDQYFSAILSPEETGTAKPDPLIFVAAQAAVGATNNIPAFHVGDSIISDVGGALAAGMLPIWVHRELPPEIRAAHPCDRPRHPLLPQIVTESASHEFCSRVYGFATADLQPAAIVVNMHEVPDTIRCLLASTSSSGRPA